MIPPFDIIESEIEANGGKVPMWIIVALILEGAALFFALVAVVCDLLARHCDSM